MGSSDSPWHSGVLSFLETTETVTRPIISCEALGKRFLIGHSRVERYTALRDVVGRQFTDLRRKTWDMLRGRQIVQGDEVEEFWALRDLTFHIQPGDVVGVIGRNGAGKSTLLKILSRITEPSTGRVTLRGRVASLLEVGTGFHPELSGRENIYLNGAILGMRRIDIRRRFDEIVEFAEVGNFLDTPVKRYSSGMYVRLAFAVAAHLEPEILVVDEVLSVGDAAFQKRCLGKMREVSTSGRTVLFVSHQLDSVKALCTRALLLESGKLARDGSVEQVLEDYLRDGADSKFACERDQRKSVQITSAEIARNALTPTLVHFALEIESLRKQDCSVDLRLTDPVGRAVGFGTRGTLDRTQCISLSEGKNFITLALSTDRLAVGAYYVSLDVAKPFVEYFDQVEKCLTFSIDHKPDSERSHAFLQNWGYGSVELDLTVIEAPR